MQHMHTHTHFLHAVFFTCPSSTNHIRLPSPFPSTRLTFVQCWDKKMKMELPSRCGHPTSQTRCQRSLQCRRAMDQCEGGAQSSIRKRSQVPARCSYPYPHTTVKAKTPLSFTVRGCAEQIVLWCCCAIVKLATKFLLLWYAFSACLQLIAEALMTASSGFVSRPGLS